MRVHKASSLFFFINTICTKLTKKYFEEQLERMVSEYLDLAEMQAMRHIPMTM